MPQDQDDIKGAASGRQPDGMDVYTHPDAIKAAMKQAPTPGPLTSDWRVGDYAVRLEDHFMVKAGDVHRVTEMFRGGYLGFARPVGGEWNPSGWRKCDADGWMPWSGGENPVPGQRVDTKFRDGYQVDGQFADRWDWAHGSPERKNADGADDIIAVRLTPTAPVETLGHAAAFAANIDTAPVEASGSERRRDGSQTDVERSAYAEGLSDAAQRARYLAKHQEWEEDDGGPNSRRDGFECACEVLSDLLEEASSGALKAALRPQPSGETREQVARIVDPGAWALHDEMLTRTDARPEGVSKYTAPSLVKADAILALISPAPVASGGQHSSGEGAAWIDPTDLEHVAEGHPLTTTLFPYAKHGATMPLYTTPARAEAQDEGAAGPSFRDVFLSWHEECGAVERAGPCAKPIGKFEARWPHFRKRLWDAAMKSPDALRDEWVKVAKECAHPSPTPAADADRVREERDLLARQLASLTSPDIDHKGAKMRLMTMRRAALKSTAAKEGGE